MTHRDQIHGDVRFDPLAVALLNTEALQRLGRVYQLGYAHLIYRGGTHTRLSHVMGAMHVAGRLVDLLGRTTLRPRTFLVALLDPTSFCQAERVKAHPTSVGMYCDILCAGPRSFTISDTCLLATR
jgi:hypothetical protein